MRDQLIKRDGYWWPADDDWCYKVIHDEVADVNDAVKLCAERRVVIQAGGNVGVWANWLALGFDTVMTFEPDYLNYCCLRLNVIDNVTHQRAALGSTNRTGSLNLVQGNAGAHWTVPGEDFPVVTIDSFGLNELDLLVLDIEGAEVDALVGATRTIKKCRPVVHFEEKGLGERYYGHGPQAAEALLKSLGYKVKMKTRKDVIMVPA